MDSIKSEDLDDKTMARFEARWVMKGHADLLKEFISLSQYDAALRLVTLLEKKLKVEIAKGQKDGPKVSH